MIPTLLICLLWITAVQALPAPLAWGSGSSTPLPGLTAAEINSLSPYANYAKAAYCQSSDIMPWTCGAACSANQGFMPIAAGGDGNNVQYWYVGYDPYLRTVIAAHQGTNKSNLAPLLTDGDITKSSLDPSLFPGVSPGILAHKGFLDEHAKTATTILNNVQLGMSKYNVNSVTMVGHSLGAAIAVLDSIYLALHLPISTTFLTLTFGLPRVGNKAFADYVDANVHLTHINHEKDPIPIVPGMMFGYVHPQGELHIETSGKWAQCLGQDNPNPECIVGTVHNLFEGNLTNHDGPYNGVIMRCNS